MGTIKIPQLAWHGKNEAEYVLPERWKVEICNMIGYNQPAMTSAQIRDILDHPIGTQTIKEMARGKHQVVILFDDMCRITHTWDFVPHILHDLAEAGITDSQIRFICATGCHRALNRLDFVKKLGENVLKRFPVFNHNPFGNCVPIGRTKTFNTEVFINEEVMKCDLKIAIGGVVPHGMSGFGGGGKIILPGVASFETTRYNHHLAHREWLPDKMGMGKFDNNPVRLDIEEAATTGLFGLYYRMCYTTNGVRPHKFSPVL